MWSVVKEQVINGNAVAIFAFGIKEAKWKERIAISVRRRSKCVGDGCPFSRR